MIPQDQSYLLHDGYASIFVPGFHFGFAPRLLPGAVLSLFTPFRGRKQLTVFFYVVLFLTFFLITWVAGRLIRSAGSDTKRMTIFFVALFLAGPYTNAFLFPRLFSPDRFIAALAVLSLVVLYKTKVRWLLPLILFAAQATHPMFTFAYMPLIALLLLYELYKNKFAKKEWLFVIVNYIVIIASTAWSYLFTGYKNVTLEEFVAFAKSKTDIPVDEEKYEGFFFLNPEKFFGYAKDISLTTDALDAELRATVFLLPLIALFVFVWVNAYRRASSKFERFLFVMCLLVPIARLPLFLTTTETYRGRIAALVVQFALILYLLYRNNEAVRESVVKLGSLLRKNVLPMLLVVSYYAATFSTYVFADDWVRWLQEFVNPRL